MKFESRGTTRVSNKVVVHSKGNYVALLATRSIPPQPTHPGWTMVRRKQHMVVYTDGSYRNRKERAAGTYAWVAGWHDETGNLGVLMHGGGKENDGDNPARGRINSTRMEALAMIRARQIVGAPCVP